MSLSIGEVAPDFTLKNQHGEDISLSAFHGDKNVVLVFFPFAFSGICTGELSEIRDDVSRSYGTFNDDVGVPDRGTFVIDREGVLRWTVKQGIGDPRHLDDVRAAIADIS